MSVYLYYSKLGKSKCKIHCPIETCVVLALIRYTKSWNKLKVIFIPEEAISTSILVDIKNIPFSLDEDMAIPVNCCQLPVFYDNEFYCVAGLCSVLRQIIQREDKFIDMLGFRGNCLSACAEQSSWTKFCEIDSMKCVANFFHGNSAWMSHLQQLELKLKQPLKIHNKSNPKRRNVNEEPRYIESQNFSLSDFILFVCFHIISIHMNDSIFDQMSETKKWYNQVITDSSLLKELSMFSREQLEPIEINTNGSDVIKSNDSIDYIKEPMSKSQKARKFLARSEDAISFINTITPEIRQQSVGYGQEFHVDTADMPYHALPESGDLPADRVDRKWQQLISMAKAIMKVCSPDDVIVDFCSGGGHLGLLLAVLLPQCRVLLLDQKPQSLARAQHRAKQLALTNLYIVQSNVDYFVGVFDVGTCLHACGVATDLVMQTCARHRASMVVSPCCYGKIQTCHTVQYPRSDWLRAQGISCADHHLMSHCADSASPHYMDWIDADRLEWARDVGYSQVFLGKLTPPECSPKNNLLVASGYRTPDPEDLR